MAIHRNQNSEAMTSFARDVDAGLSAPFKFLLSRYFYDAKGDTLFQEIMRMPEYYLTDAEYEIFLKQGADLLDAMKVGDGGFDLVEFGAGDGYKTKVLINSMLAENATFTYRPIDISSDVLAALKYELSLKFPALKVEPQHAEYFTALEQIGKKSALPKLVLFLGSSIGNFTEERTVAFLNALFAKLNRGDKALIGFDLKKNPEVILKAYNDPAGITKRFNLNILTRINRQLKGHFDLQQFAHFPTYNPESGFARSYLVSLVAQEVPIDVLDKSFHFAEGECIHTEISRKYSIPQIEALLENSGFTVHKHFTDSRGYYVNTLAEKTTI